MYEPVLCYAVFVALCLSIFVPGIHIVFLHQALRHHNKLFWAQIGALVYARVISSDRDLDPELSCVDAHGKVRRLP